MLPGVSPERTWPTPPQAEVLASGLLDSGFNCVLQMPTGSGKTWLAERAIEETLRRGHRAIYLTPLRALAAELTARWQTILVAFEVGIFTGDFGRHTAYPVAFKDAHLLVMTPERLDACTRAWRAHWAWIPEVDLVVVDEFHLLGDRHRGARLEGALSRFQRLNPFARLLALSATLGNRHELADWLGGIEYASTWRPVPLEWRVVRYRRATDKPDLLAAEVSRTTGMGGKSLVFVQSRRRAEELGRFLTGLGLRAAHHHAGLSRPERQRIEDGFRGTDVDLLVATSTLEMGLNLPVRQVVLYDLQAFDGAEFRPLPVTSVWQRAGRAGRPGLDTAGEAVLLAPVWDREARRYAEGKFESVRSGLTDAHAMAEQVIAEVAAGLARTAGQLRTVFATSLAAHQSSLPGVEPVVQQMLEAGMLREAPHAPDGSRAATLQATTLGRVAVRHMLMPATVLLFRRVLEARLPLTFLDLLLLATSSHDCEPVLPVDFDELDGLASGLAAERSGLLHLPRAELAALLGVDGKRLLAAVNAALAARTWTRLGDVGPVAEQHGCYPFEVERLCDSLDRLLLGMTAVCNEDPPSDAPGTRERIRVLHSMVLVGLDEAVVTLTVIAGLGPTMARRLAQAGIRDIEELALAEPERLARVPGLSPRRATRWTEEATELVKAHSAYRYREEGPTLEFRPPGWPATIDPYRLRRALDLAVTPTSHARYRVTGGLEPHEVSMAFDGALHCDCADATRGSECKHVLAIRLHHGDRQLHSLSRSLRSAPAGAALDLFDLWFSGGRARDRAQAG